MQCSAVRVQATKKQKESEAMIPRRPLCGVCDVWCLVSFLFFFCQSSLLTTQSPLPVDQVCAECVGGWSGGVEWSGVWDGVGGVEWSGVEWMLWSGVEWSVDRV